MENVWYAVNSSVEESLIFLCIELFYFNHSSFLVEILNWYNGSFLQEWNKTKEKD